MESFDEIRERGHVAGFVIAELLGMLVGRQVTPGRQVGALRNSSGHLELISCDGCDLMFLAVLRVERDRIHVSFPGWAESYELGFSLVPGGVWTTRLHGPNVEPLISSILDGIQASGLSPNVTAGLGRLSHPRTARGTGSLS